MPFCPLRNTLSYPLRRPLRPNQAQLNPHCPPRWIQAPDPPGRRPALDLTLTRPPAPMTALRRLVATATLAGVVLGQFVCDTPTNGCSNGMFNKQKCECECISPFCPDAGGDCSTPTDDCGGNPWVDCERGVDCPWWIHPMKAEACIPGPDVSGRLRRRRRPLTRAALELEQPHLPDAEMLAKKTAEMAHTSDFDGASKRRRAKVAFAMAFAIAIACNSMRDRNEVKPKRSCAEEPTASGSEKGPDTCLILPCTLHSR